MTEQTIERLPYSHTRSFSKLVYDYVQDAVELEPFYRHKPNLQGMAAAMEARQHFPNNREVLAEVLKEQYNGYALTEAQLHNLASLSSDTTFTVTTAHQPNIFTGPLYFIYKIAHAVRLASYLKEQFPQHHFVPVYYMGSEDADLDELGHFYIEGEKIAWQTDQQGAVGRMHTQGLGQIIDRLQGQYAHLPYGPDMVAMLRKAYQENDNIQEATMQLVDQLFRHTGLLVLIPDNARLKQLFTPIVRRELLEGFSQPLVLSTLEAFSRHYKVQTEGRPINLFYLDESGRRERIEKSGDGFMVEALGLHFSTEEMLALAGQRPELFSANVILRGVFQETVLPNIAFIGGGGELAYWMELRAVFEAAGVPYPVLVLRNSFLLMQEQHQHWQRRAGLATAELFDDELTLLNRETERQRGESLSLQRFEEGFFNQYNRLQELAGQIDPTLQPHVAALHTRAVKGLHQLEKKLQRAARRGLQEEGEAIRKLKRTLFPGGGLQERQENFMPLYARYGPRLVDHILAHSLALEPAFTVMHLPESLNTQAGK